MHIWKEVWGQKDLLPKIRMFVWRLLVSVLPLRNILHWFVESMDPMCPLCDEEPETAHHAFFSCRIVKPVRRDMAYTIIDLINNDAYVLDSWYLMLQQCLTEEMKKLLIYSLWSIWLQRNGIVFQNAPISVQTTCARALTFKILLFVIKYGRFIDGSFCLVQTSYWVF